MTAIPNCVGGTNHKPQELNDIKKTEHLKNLFNGTVIGLSSGIVIITADQSLRGTLIGTLATSTALFLESKKKSLSTIFMKAFVYQAFLGAIAIDTSLIKHFSSNEILIISGILGITGAAIVDFLKSFKFPEMPL